MQIRAEQMTVFETTAKENFVRRIAKHLLENYGAAVVRLPKNVESAVEELEPEKLHSLVKISIERARSYGLTFESSIAAFSALMFEVAPNFDSHRLIKMLLRDENLQPEARLDELLKVLSDKNWETIRAEYDVNAWQSDADTGGNADGAEQTENKESSDFAKTVMNIEPPKNPTNPVAIDDINFNGTMMNAEGAKKIDNSGTAANSGFPDTVFNINIVKE